MSIKVIAVDLDGTLLKGDCTISERTKAAIENAQKAGYQVVPTTGRSFRSTKTMLEEIDGIKYSINANGSMFLEMGTEEVVASEYISSEAALKIYDICDSYEVFVEWYTEKETYVLAKQKKYLKECGLNEEYIEQLSETIYFIDDIIRDMIARESLQISKIHMLCKNKEDKKELLMKFREMDDVFITETMDSNIELVKDGISKQSGIINMCRHLGFQKDEVMAIGDSMNDLEMFQYVGYPVAMGNAIPKIKKLAKKVTEDNENDGVAVAIEEILQKQKRA